MLVFTVESGAVFSAEIDPSLLVEHHIEYTYDADGNRVRKYYSNLDEDKYYVHDASGECYFGI